MASADEVTAGLSWSTPDVVVEHLYRQEAENLVRLARFFVDDRDAAEDLVQEAFIRLARSVHRIRQSDRIPAYLRSIVLNLARDHNRRGLVSLRHQGAVQPSEPSIEDQIGLREDQQLVIDALRDLPKRQRDCLVLKYYVELAIPEIAETLSLSANSVKTHLQRGLRNLEQKLGARE